MIPLRFLFLLGILGVTLPLFGQTTIRGRVTDAQSGEALAAATIHIKDTYRGTISNNQGDFELPVPAFPATLVIRFIGYETQNLELQSPDEGELDIELKPVRVELREILITGEDPAIEIMHKVIERKLIWRDMLDTYRAEAYTRQRLENDTGIVSITESLSEAFWDKKRGSREVIKYKQQTGNLDASENFAAATFVPNFYDDNLTISGFDIVGPTHPKAHDYYHFKLEGFRQIDDKTIFDISIRPRRKLQPTFVGTISVLDEVFAMIEVDLIPSDAVMFPPPIQEFGLYYKQQFSNFESDFWLPVDVRIEGNILLGFSGLRFPPITFHQLTRISNYEVNGVLPDSLYELRQRLFVDSLTLASPVNFREQGLAVPLTEQEEKAYETVDTTMTLEKAFRPKGALARFIDDDEDGESNRRRNTRFGRYLDGFTPNIWYNRADGTRLGVSYTVPLKVKHTGVTLQTGYSTAMREPDYGVSLEFRPAQRSTWQFQTVYRTQTVVRNTHAAYSMTLTSIPTLLGGSDYHDYYRSDQFSAGAAYTFRKSGIRVQSDVFSESDRSVITRNHYSIPGGILQRPNPSVDEGMVRGLRHQIRFGETGAPFGVVGNKKLIFRTEHAHNFLGSDHNYVRFEVSAQYRLETFLKRRLLPNVLDIALNAGASYGDLPIQKHLFGDGSLHYFTPFGGFKTLQGRAYEGEYFTGIFWEHNFRTTPFELIGWQWAASKGMGVILFGASGRSWMSSKKKNRLDYIPLETGSGHHEIGLSINGIFSIVRIDAAFRADQPGFYGGLSLARLF